MAAALEMHTDEVVVHGEDGSGSGGSVPAAKMTD